MKILVAVDLKNGAERVVADAALWATRTHATIDLLYVDELRSATPYVNHPELQTQFQLEWTRLCREDENDLKALLQALPEAARGEVHLATGPAAAAIVERAPAYDMVVVATAGRTGIAHFWLGSIAERVVRTSPRPVLVLRLS
jgi:nucleotide-binding universal stress UspA family protein